jgi:hypothetical protein
MATSDDFNCETKYGYIESMEWDTFAVRANMSNGNDTVYLGYLGSKRFEEGDYIRYIMC